MKRLIFALVALTFATSAYAGKSVDTSVQDAALNKLATGTHWTFCSAQPANYAGISAVMLITKTVTAGGGNGFYTLAQGDAGAGSRKVTMAAQTSMTPSANGTVTYACIDDGSLLLGCTTVTSQAVTTAQSWNSPTFKFEIGIPQ